MELINGIETRRSIRSFKTTPVPDETLKKILEAASKSPSYSNTQPWEVAVVTGKKKEDLSQLLYNLAKTGVTPNPDMPSPRKWPVELDTRAREHGARRFQAIGIERENQQQRLELRLLNFEFYGAPCVLFLFMDNTLGAWSIFDMGLFVQTLALAAHGYGLGTCLQAALAGYPDAVRDFLGMPRSKKLVIGISMGYPDQQARINSYHSARVGLDASVKWHR